MGSCFSENTETDEGHEMKEPPKPKEPILKKVSSNVGKQVKPKHSVVERKQPETVPSNVQEQEQEQSKSKPPSGKSVRKIADLPQDARNAILEQFATWVVNKYKDQEFPKSFTRSCLERIGIHSLQSLWEAIEHQKNHGSFLAAMQHAKCSLDHKHLSILVEAMKFRTSSDVLKACRSVPAVKVKEVGETVIAKAGFDLVHFGAFSGIDDGTATRVDPTTLITAGHMVYWNQVLSASDWCPGKGAPGGGTAQDCLHVESIWAFKGLQQCGSTAKPGHHMACIAQEDFAVVKITDEHKDHSNTWPQPIAFTDANDKCWMAAGYPGYELLLYEIMPDVHNALECREELNKHWLKHQQVKKKANVDNLQAFPFYVKGGISGGPFFEQMPMTEANRVFGVLSATMSVFSNGFDEILDMTAFKVFDSIDLRLIEAVKGDQFDEKELDLINQQRPIICAKRVKGGGWEWKDFGDCISQPKSVKTNGMFPWTADFKMGALFGFEASCIFIFSVLLFVFWLARICSRREMSVADRCKLVCRRSARRNGWRYEQGSDEDVDELEDDEDGDETESLI